MTETKLPAKAPDLPRVPSGVRNLDALLDGGLPRGSVTVLAGPPGSGKTLDKGRQRRARGGQRAPEPPRDGEIK